MSMEFVMGNSLETLPKTIDFNFEELKGQLAESLALYTGLVVTEDGIKGCQGGPRQAEQAAGGPGEQAQGGQARVHGPVHRLRGQGEGAGGPY